MLRTAGSGKLLYLAMKHRHADSSWLKTYKSSMIRTSIEEMVRCKEHGFVCWHTHSNYNSGSEDTSLDDPYYLPLLEKAAELGLYVYLHPQVSNIGRLLKYGYM